MEDATRRNAMQRYSNFLFLFKNPLYLPHSSQNLPLTTVTSFIDDTLSNEDLSNLAGLKISNETP
jgi:hypothetical protein